MKFWKKILFTALIIFLLFFISIHIIVNIKGRVLLTQKLEETFHRKVRIGSLRASYLSNIYIKDIEVEGLFKIEEVYAGGGVFDIFRNNFNLSLLKISQPVVTLEREFIQAVSEAFVSSSGNLQQNKQEGQGKTIVPEKIKPNLNPLAVPQNRFLSAEFSVNRIIVSDGTLIFIDKIKDTSGISIRIENINLEINNLNPKFFGSQKTSFKLKGEIPWREGQEKGKIEVEGWLDLFKRDMQATLKIEDIDGVYLYPYYSRWVDLEKARIEKAKLNFSSNVKGVNNNITADCHLELTDIVRKQRSGGEEENKEEKVASAVLDIFRALNQGKIVLDFTIRTRMDRPEFGFGNIRMALENKIAKARGIGIKAKEVLMFPTKLIEGTIRKSTDISRAVVDGTVAVARELKNAIAGAFKK